MNNIMSPEATTKLGMVLIGAIPNFNPNLQTLGDSLLNEKVRLVRVEEAASVNSVDDPFKILANQKSYGTSNQALATVAMLRTVGPRTSDPWRDLPTITSYSDMDELENAEAAEVSILQAMRNQGW